MWKQSGKTSDAENLLLIVPNQEGTVSGDEYIFKIPLGDLPNVLYPCDIRSPFDKGHILSFEPYSNSFL